MILSPKKKQRKRKEKKRKKQGKKKEKKAATVQRLKPKNCSYSAIRTNQIGTIVTVQTIKKNN